MTLLREDQNLEKFLISYLINSINRICAWALVGTKKAPTADTTWQTIYIYIYICDIPIMITKSLDLCYTYDLKSLSTF